MTEERKPDILLIEESMVKVPVREAAQRAFEMWLLSKADELAEVLAPWQLVPSEHLAFPVLERIVHIGEGRWIGDVGRGPQVQSVYLTDEEMALFREARVSAGSAVKINVATDEEQS